VSREQIEVRYTKWGGIDHWHFVMDVLGQDEHGWWLFGRKGMTLQRGAEPEVPQRQDFALLVPAEGCWTACFNAEGELDIYADVTTRPVRTGAQVTAVDLDLDVVRFAGGRVAVLDEDEFAEHQAELAYPAELIAQARATCDWLVGAVSARAEPFGQASGPWLARARQSA
jgi:hypothetical protein